MNWGSESFMALMLVILSLDIFPYIQFKQTFPKQFFYIRSMLDARQAE